jgi:hypothetical protein
MNGTDQTAPVWGQETPPPYGTAPSPPRRRPSRVGTIVVAAIAAVVLVGGGIAVAKAANSGSSNTQGPGGNGGQFDGRGGQFGGPGGANGLSGALYGDFVASDGNNGYVTKRLQAGTVTAVSSTSITAKSADGHSTTFVVNSSTSVDNGIDAISDVKTGDTVTVVGTVSGSLATATSVFDVTLNQANGNQMGNPRG